MRRFFHRFFGLWATRSLMVGGLTTIVDLGCVVALVELFECSRVLAAAVGVAVGASLNFLLTKYFAFRDRDPNLAPQALKYAAATVAAMAVHAGFVFAFTHLLGVHYVISKFIADFVVFTCGHLLLVRYVIFAPAAQRLARAMAGTAERTEGAPSPA